MMSEKIKKFDEELLKRCLDTGVEQVKLSFQGGSDEGFLTVRLLPEGSGADDTLETDIEEWAWRVYSYSGAGDGNDYGDDITYDLKAKKIITSEWTMERQDSADEFHPWSGER